MVHKLKHRHIAPVVVVISRALQVELLALVANVGYSLALGNGGKPREVMLLVVTEEDTARLRSPGPDRTVESESRAYPLALENYVVVAQVALAIAVPYRLQSGRYPWPELRLCSILPERRQHLWP